MKNPSIYFVALFLCSLFDLQAQSNTAPVRTVDFTLSPAGNAYRFEPIPAPLQQKAGAPKAFWTYYWEFGDGAFSFEDKPSHVYVRAGNYNPILQATAHYDDGKLPDKKGKGITADRSGNSGGNFPTVFDSTRIPIRMKASRQARANEEMTCILSYRNLGMLTTDGRLHFFFNEKRFPNAHFALDSARTYFNEKPDAAVSQVSGPEQQSAWTLLSPSTHTGVSTAQPADFSTQTILQNLLNAARGAYREEKIWRFTNLQPGEKRNMFISIHGTDKMLQDTNAFIHLEAIFAPFDPMIAPERYELEFEIVSSHDPNAIMVSDSRVNYRLIGSKKLDYKVQFQNNGEGPASKVELKIEIPEGLNMKQMRPVEWYPKCPVCPNAKATIGCLDTASTKDGLLFTFRNIYLPGTRQKDVDNRDSTKGYVRYRIEAEHGMPKRSFRSRAKITFDKNDPIYTNYTRTRFKVGLSPGLKVGFGFEPGFDQQKTVGGETTKAPFIQNGYAFLGVSLSPFKSWRVYPQVELLTGIKGRGDAETTHFARTSFSPVADQHPLLEKFMDTLTVDSMISVKRGFVSFELPLLIRKNFTRWFGAGLGGSVWVLLDNGQTSTAIHSDLISYHVMDTTAGMLEVVRDVSHQETKPVISTFNDTRLRYSAFADLSFGSVRKGFNLGIRGGAIFGPDAETTPFAQVSLELKL